MKKIITVKQFFDGDMPDWHPDLQMFALMDSGSVEIDSLSTPWMFDDTIQISQHSVRVKNTGQYIEVLPSTQILFTTEGK